MHKISRNNTTQDTRADGSKTVTLHSTVVIQWWPADRKVRLYTGGWNTSTTRTRMNQALNEWQIPASVSMAKGVPSVRLTDGTTHQFSRDGLCYFTY